MKIYSRRPAAALAADLEGDNDHFHYSVMVYYRWVAEVKDLETEGFLVKIDAPPPGGHLTYPALASRPPNGRRQTVTSSKYLKRRTSGETAG